MYLLVCSILDATKIWPENLVPLREVGELVLNRTVDEFFPEVEQVSSNNLATDTLLMRAIGSILHKPCCTGDRVFKRPASANEEFFIF